MLRRMIDDVCFSSEEVGGAIVRADDKSQREVLIAMANAVDAMSLRHGSWPMQCGHIVDGCAGPGSGLADNDRSRIASMLDCLLDHLREPVESVKQP